MQHRKAGRGAGQVNTDPREEAKTRPPLTMLKLLCCCRRSRRRKEERAECGDIEMGGGQSKLVVERVRMIEQPKEEPVKKHGPTVLERRQMLERPPWTEAPPKRQRPASAKLQLLRSQSGARPCDMCGEAAFATEGVEVGRAWYHRTCLRCGFCGRSLVGVPFGRLSPEDDVLYCDEATSRSGRSCLNRLRSGVPEDIEREAENQRLSDADRASLGVAKTRAVDMIGDDLDKIVRQMVPTCAACGHAFGARDKLVMQGMVKYHEACLYGGPPPDVRLDPRRAIEDAPSTLLLKLKPQVQGARIMTFFTTRKDDPDVAVYEPDANSRAPKKRKAKPAALHGATVKAIGASGADLAPPATAAFVDDATLRAAFAWRAVGLDWNLTADFNFDADALSFAVAALTVTPTNGDLSSSDDASPSQGPASSPVLATRGRDDLLHLPSRRIPTVDLV